MTNNQPPALSIWICRSKREQPITSLDFDIVSDCVFSTQGVSASASTPFLYLYDNRIGTESAFSIPDELVIFR
jgi:hypothetical protein